MRFPENGQAPQALLKQLAERKHGDLNWQDGRVFAYVYDAGPEAMQLLTEAYSLFLVENGLDPTSFPSLLELEREVIGMALDLQQAPDGACGSFTTGGTESILLSVKTARDHARATRPQITRPQLVLPETAHAAFYKACAYFDVEPVRVPVDPLRLTADPRAMADAITDQTLMLVASAPSYAHGVVDPIGEIGELAQSRGLLFHVDCCVGGMYLPFAQELGGSASTIPDFNFRVPGVTQLSMDFHKWGYAAKGASAILYRDRALRAYQIFAWSGWTGYTVVNPTICSTKSGGPLAACWAILNHLGRRGYLDLVARTQAGAAQARAGIEGIDGLQLLGDPPTNLMAFSSDTIDVFALADDMKARGWYIQPQFGFGPSPANIHLSIGAGNLPALPQMLGDLADCTAARRAAGVRTAPPRVEINGQAPEALFDQLAQLAGSDGTALPERMDALNNVLNGMPHGVRDRLLAEYINRLYVPV